MGMEKYPTESQDLQRVVVLLMMMMMMDGMPIPTFRRNLLPPFPSSSSDLKVAVSVSSETLLPMYQTARQHIQ
jgi:pseudouridine-5'-phosphate glycosidase